MPPALIAPGLDKSLAYTIFAALDFKGQNRKKNPVKPAGLDDLDTVLGPPGGRPWSSFFSALTPAEERSLAEEADRYRRKKAGEIKVSRFVRRNSIALSAGAAALVIAAAIVAHSISAAADRFNTRGMESSQVVESFYRCFNSLDSEAMEACVYPGVAKEDINLVINYFLVGRMRHQYDGSTDEESPQVWLDAGSPGRAFPLFGITDLKIDNTRTGNDEQTFVVTYTLWIPKNLALSAEDLSAIPANELIKADLTYNTVLEDLFYMEDTVTLARYKKDAWRIKNIERRNFTVE